MLFIIMVCLIVGLAAREWIAGSTAIYIIDKLVNDPSLREMATKIHW
jgi:hypothetical protein